MRGKYTKGKNSTEPDRLPPEHVTSWHDRETLPCGKKIGKIGSLWYVLDESGEPVSKGYHRISDDGTYGKIGGREEQIQYID